MTCCRVWHGILLCSMREVLKRVLSRAGVEIHLGSTSKTFQSMYMRELFTRVHVEVGTSP